MEKKNRHKSKKHHHSKIEESENFSPKDSSHDRRVPPLRIKPLLIKPLEQRQGKATDHPILSAETNITSDLSRDLIDDIQSKALSVSVHRMEQKLVQKYIKKVTEGEIKQIPSDPNDDSSKKPSSNEIPTQQVGKLVLKLRTDKKSSAEKASIWK